MGRSNRRSQAAKRSNSQCARYKKLVTQLSNRNRMLVESERSGWTRAWTCCVRWRGRTWASQLICRPTECCGRHGHGAGSSRAPQRYLAARLQSSRWSRRWSNQRQSAAVAPAVGPPTLGAAPEDGSEAITVDAAAPAPSTAVRGSPAVKPKRGFWFPSR